MTRPQEGALAKRWEWLIWGLILLLAVGLRLYRLGDVPPGLTHDEAGNGRLAVGVLEGDRPLYFAVSNGREPLYVYSMAPVVAAFGPTKVAVRLTSVLWGVALILVTWAWVREAFNPVTALLAAASLGVGFWPLMVSRVGVRAVTLPVLFTASVYFMWRFMWRAWQADARKAAGWRFCILAGLLLGASFYTYMASRALPLIPLVFVLYLALFRRLQPRVAASSLLIILVVAALVAAPLWLYLRSHPQSEARIDQLAEPWRQAQAGNWDPLKENVLAALKMFTFRGAGDPHWIYNLSGRPLLDPLSGVLFYMGLALALWRWRDAAHFIILLWLAVGLAPVYITGANSSVLRAVAVQPAVAVLQALGLEALVRHLYRYFKRYLARRLPALVAGLVVVLSLGLMTVITVQTYFDRWPNQRDVRVAYRTALVESARYLDQQSEGGTAVVSSIYPGALHDPLTFDFSAQRDDLETRWCDARFGLILPDVPQAWAVFSALAPLDAALTPFFVPAAQLTARVTLRPDDLDPWFEVYRWRPRAVAERLPLKAPLDVGHVLDFVGHQLLTPSVPPGGTVELLTFWRVPEGGGTDQAATGIRGAPLVLFTHVLDDAGQIVGQQDRLDVPAWTWAPGDRLVQLHRFPLDADLPRGNYALHIGVYRQTEGYPRLTVYDPDAPGGTADHIVLSALKVTMP